MTRTAAWLVARLGVILVPAWIVGAAAAVHFLPGISQGSGGALGGLVLRHSPALEAQQQEVRAFGNTLLTRILVVQHADGGLTRAQVRRTLSLAATVDRRRTNRFRYLRVAAPIVSPHRTTTVTYLYFTHEASNAQALDVAHAYAQALDPPALRAGPILARATEFSQIRRSLPWVGLATVALIVLVLVVSFRAVAPPLLVLGTAGIAYLVSTRLLAWLAEQRHETVPKEVEPVLLALLLGLATDYAIFFLAGARRRLAEGSGRIAAAEASARENLPIIVTAGLIVSLGSLSLTVGRLDVFRSFGPGMAVTVVVALAVAITLIPGLLALLGPAAFWPSLRRERPTGRRFWHAVTARPVSALVVLVLAAALLAGALGLVGMKLGFTIVRGQPGGAEVKRAQENVQDGFPAGITGPTELLLRGRSLGQREKDIAILRKEISRLPGVAFAFGSGRFPNGTFVSKDGRTARLLVVLEAEPVDAHAIDALQGLRRVTPALLRRADLSNTTASFAGDTALAEETIHSIREDAVRVGFVVLAVNLVLLALFLRAVWAPLYLLAASVLALGAALGITTWVMQGGLAHDDVTYYVPFAAAVLLLSLGSDYNVFVVGRIKRSARDRPLREAIAIEAPRTSSTITTAGLTLGGSFGLLALIPLRPMRELALALALGILLDTFVVRGLLVPSLLALFRRREQGREEADPTRP